MRNKLQNIVLVHVVIICLIGIIYMSYVFREHLTATYVQPTVDVVVRNPIVSAFFVLIICAELFLAFRAQRKLSRYNDLNNKNL